MTLATAPKRITWDLNRTVTTRDHASSSTGARRRYQTREEWAMAVRDLIAAGYRVELASPGNAATVLKQARREFGLTRVPVTAWATDLPARTYDDCAIVPEGEVRDPDARWAWSLATLVPAEDAARTA